MFHMLPGREQAKRVVVGPAAPQEAGNVGTAAVLQNPSIGLPGVLQQLSQLDPQQQQQYLRHAMAAQQAQQMQQ